MNKSKKDKKNIYNFNCVLYFKFLLLGAFLTELIYILFSLGSVFYNLCLESKSFNLLYASYIVIPIVFVSHIIINFKAGTIKTIKYIKSKRIELLLFILIGALIIYSLDGFGIAGLINNVNFSLLQMSIIIFGITFLFILFSLSKIKIKIKENRTESVFLDDNEIYDLSKDEFDLEALINNFSEKVIDNFSSNSLVFGLEAPWGAGKSSFLNLCKKVWEDDEKYKHRTIVYKFKVLNFENQEELLNKFTIGLVSEINKHVYNPNLKILTSKYLKLLNAEFSFRGISISLPINNNSIEEIFNKIQSEISKTGKKIIIIIDDLDRLDYKSILEILRFMKYAFSMKNVSYILCYDADNIRSSSNKDKEEIIEFFEKFINVKYSLYYDYEKILNVYIPENKDEYKNDNEKIRSSAKSGLRDIFHSEEFYKYLPIVGDIRKVKQLVNTINLLDIQQYDFLTIDIVTEDLINLLLIYIKYPKLFRTIFVQETNNQRGFFSIVYGHEKGYPEDDNNSNKNIMKHKNSKYYNEFIENLKKENRETEIFLLNKLFDINQPKSNAGNQFGKFPYAYLNGGIYNDNRYLENYLYLITRMQCPDKSTQESYYINLKNKIIDGEEPIENVIGKLPIVPFKKVFQQDKLWRAITNTEAREYTKISPDEIIKFAVKSIAKYPMLYIENYSIGMRQNMIQYILVLLENVGWRSHNGNKGENSTENISEIEDWIVGKGNHDNEGILNSLIDNCGSNKILALYDLLLFRDYIVRSTNSNSWSLFNVASALDKVHQEGKTSLDLSVISKYIYNYFKSNYIDKDINVFEHIYLLSEDDILGERKLEIINATKEAKISISDNMEMCKSSVINFIIDQLFVIAQYSPSIEKEEKINIISNIIEYIFNKCFSKDISGYEYFIKYLLVNFTHNVLRDKLVFEIKNFIKNDYVKKALKQYWEKNRKEIIAKKFEEKEKKIFTYGYTATYKGNLPEVYKKLDDSLKEKDYE